MTDPARFLLAAGAGARSRVGRLLGPAWQRTSLPRTSQPGEPGFEFAARGAVCGPHGWSWSPTPLGADSAQDLDRTRLTEDAVTIRLTSNDRAQVATGVSGAVGVYYWSDPAGGAALVCSRPEDPVEAGLLPPRADWDAWAQIIATGGPLEGRTPFASVRRLGPGQVLDISADGHLSCTDADWEWLEEPAVVSIAEGLDRVAEALDRRVGELSSRDQLHVPLSGGWDSRTLAALASRHQAETQAWTTSKDTGTAWEELIARQVSRRLDLRHQLVHPDAAGYADDLEAYARTVSYQTSYHVWLARLAQHLGELEGTVLDGLGGGVFFGGAFPPSRGVSSARARRFAGTIRYLNASNGILHPAVERNLLDRCRAGFEAATRHLHGHRDVDALTAYVTRTLPGISLGPFGLFAGHLGAAAPFLDHEVVLSSLAMPTEERRDRRLYRHLLRRWAPEITDLPTANEPPPRGRRRPQRGAAAVTAAALRAAILDHQVAALLHPALLQADVDTWRQHLESRADQHLLRSLWMCALWIDRYEPAGDGPDVMWGRRR